MSYQKPTIREKIAYALGDAAAGGITWKIMSIAFPLFFTNVFGLTFADAAALMLIARLFDVVTDPIMGSLADRTQSRWGTYRPWLIFGAIPFGLIFALLLYTPDFSPAGKRVYAYVLYLLMMAVYTAVNVPYGSLLGVMTDDDNEKNQFSSYRMVGAYAMGFITLLSFPYLQKMVGGTDAHQYAVLGAVFGIIAAAMTLACGLMTKERLKPVRAEKYSLSQFVDLFKNKPWIYLTLIGLCTNFFNGFRYAVAGYLISYCLGGDVTVGSLIINYTVLMAFGEAKVCQMGGLQTDGIRLVGRDMRGVLGTVLLHTDESQVYMADGCSGDTHVGRCGPLLTVAVVNVCRCGRFCHRKVRNIIDRTDILIGHHGSEIGRCHIWLIDCPAAWIGRSTYDS